MTIMITQVKQQLAIVKLKYEWKIEEIKRQYFLTSQVCKFDLELQYCLYLSKENMLILLYNSDVQLILVSP